MITLRRAQQRYTGESGEQSASFTFYAQAADDALAEGFGVLVFLDEVRLPPTGVTRVHAQRYAETLTYVLTGAIAYDDTLGRSGVLQAGEFRCVTATRGVDFSEANASDRHWAHFFRVGLRATSATPASPPAAEQRRFSAADRRDRLCLIAAPVPCLGVLHSTAEAVVYSALLRPGQHLAHDLRAHHGAWLHVVTGEITLADLSLTCGDGVGISGERVVSFTARSEAEVLLIDVN